MSAGAEGQPELCDHCALPVLRRAQRFCCSGCFLAHHLLSRGENDGEGRSDRLLARLVVSGFLSMGVMVFSLSLYGMEGEVASESARALQGLFRLGAFVLSVPVFLLLGLPLADAVFHLGRRLSAETLVLAGVSAAWLVSAWNTFFDGRSVYYETASMVLVLFTLGRWLDARSRERARERLTMLAEERVKPAVRVERQAETEVAPDALRVGDVVRVRPGEVIPVDGEVIEGRSFVDTSCLSGEEVPQSVAAGDRVLAGARTLDGSVLVRASAVSGARIRDEIDRLLAESTTNRAALVRVADRVAAFFLPLVLCVAFGTVVWHWKRAGVETALLHGLSVVLIACPCALGLATPLAFWVALGEAWRQGVLVRGGEVLERLARARRAFFDKTGTLTTGSMELRSVALRPGVDRHTAGSIAAALEQESEHPIGRALTRAWCAGDGAPLPSVVGFRALPGVGVEGAIAGVTYRLRRMGSEELDDPDSPETAVLLLRGEEPLAEFRLAAAVRPEARAAIAGLQRRGLRPEALTGDARGPARALQAELGLPVQAELLPAEKVERIRAEGAQGTLFVGDGLNDALALSAADVGISMRSASATSLESASVNLLRDDLALLPRVLDLARSAVRTARMNLVWAFGYNAAGLWLAATGRLTPIFAASAMVVSSVLVVLNSARLRTMGSPPARGGQQPAEDSAQAAQAARGASYSTGRTGRAAQEVG